MKSWFTDGTGKLDQSALWAAGYRCTGASTSPIQDSELTTACTRRGYYLAIPASFARTGLGWQARLPRPAGR